VTKSIYRGWRNVPADVQVQDVAVAGKTSPRSGENQPTQNHARLRRAAPVDMLLPRTAAWIESLPAPVRPQTLASQFARIANQLCATWHDPESCRRYLQELLIDRRGNRKGFPMTVLRELLALRHHYATLHPAPESRWDRVGDVPR
jgi:hypothetical protein